MCIARRLHLQLNAGHPPRPGDYLVSVGGMSSFWAGFFAHTMHLKVTRKERSYLFQNILTPRPKNREGLLLSKLKLLTSCIDNSDGLYPSIRQLAQASQLSFTTNFDGMHFHPAVVKVARLAGLDPVRFCLGWGDWQLLGTVRPTDVSRLLNVMREVGSPCHVIGKAEKGSPSVKLRMAERVGDMMPLESERFGRKSWFSAGIQSYVDALRKGRLLMS